VPGGASGPDVAPAGIRRIRVPGLATAGAPFSHMVVDGTYAFLSGVVTSDVPGGAAAHGDLAREAELVMAAIRDALAGIGLGMERIVRVDVHLTDLGRMPEFDLVYRQYFPQDALPARTCTQSAKLAGGSNVEITVLARLVTTGA
jgi:2-iminobutanoate/2-iminopropanoate deaminase